jgi:uncharacterized protein YktA (UPF0223 family)
VQNFGRFRTGNLEHVAHNVQILPTNENFNSAKFQCFQRIVDTKAVLARILADFIKVSTYGSRNITPPLG